MKERREKMKVRRMFGQNDLSEEVKCFPKETLSLIFCKKNDLQEIHFKGEGLLFLVAFVVYVLLRT